MMKKLMLKPKQVLMMCAVALFFSACGQGGGKEEAAGTQEHTEMETTDSHAGHDMQQGGMSKMMDLMHENMKDMQAVKMTGDADLDFARMMAAHHQGAITMAEEEIANGTDADLKAMATKMVAASKAEQSKLEDFVESHQPASGNMETSMKLMEPMKTMMSSMNHDEMGGNTDHHFAMMMGMHHQSAIDMSKAYLDMAKVPAIKELAQKIVADQQKEKQQLDDFLKQHPK